MAILQVEAANPFQFWCNASPDGRCRALLRRFEAWKEGPRFIIEKSPIADPRLIQETGGEIAPVRE